MKHREYVIQKMKYLINFVNELAIYIYEEIKAM